MAKSQYTKPLQVGPGKNMPSNPPGMRQQGVGKSANNLNRHKGTSTGTSNKKTSTTTTTSSDKSSKIADALGKASDLAGQMKDPGLGAHVSSGSVRSGASRGASYIGSFDEYNTEDAAGRK